MQVFNVPKVIFNCHSHEIQREFIRGFADVAGNIRRSNRDQNGQHRVYIDILNSNIVSPKGWSSSLHKLISDFSRKDVLCYFSDRYLTVAKWDMKAMWSSQAIN